MFYTLAERKDTTDQELIIENLDVSNDHWHSLDSIIKIADELELLLYGKPDFSSVQNKLIQFFLATCKKVPRISTCRFYKDKESLVCLCISDLQTFKPENFLKRNISINFKKQNKHILISDITREEWNKVKDEKLSLPNSWQLEETFTNKYSKYKQLFS